MHDILPVETNRTTARAQFLAKLVLPRAKEATMTPLREIIKQRRLNTIFQPISLFVEQRAVVAKQGGQVP